MIEHARYFRESHLPRELPHRHDELDSIAATLQPAVNGETPDDILLSGPSGVGKTVVARTAVDKLYESAGVRTAHIRCLGRSAGAVMHEAVAEHPRAHDRKLHQCTPVGEKAAALKAIADNYLLVLDEADDVHKTDLLDRLAEMDGVSYIAICHNPQEWIPSLSTPASRRLHTHIEFEAYSVAALTEILAQRATRGLVDDAVGTRTLEAIAERVDGVARLGIRTLFQAAQLAAEQHRDRIQREDIPPALSRARAAVRKSNLRSLPIGHLLVYHIIQQADGELEAGAFHDRYDELAPQVFEGHPSYTPATQQTRRRYLEKLAEYDLVGWHGKKRGRTYFARDPELKIPQESGISVPSNIPQ